MIPNTENSEGSTTAVRINEFSKVAKLKIDIKIHHISIYKQQLSRKEVKKTI